METRGAYKYVTASYILVRDCFGGFYVIIETKKTVVRSLCTSIVFCLRQKLTGTLWKITSTVLPGKRANFFNSLFLWSKQLQYTYNISRYHKTLLFQGLVLTLYSHIYLIEKPYNFGQLWSKFSQILNKSSNISGIVKS